MLNLCAKISLGLRLANVPFLYFLKTSENYRNSHPEVFLVKRCSEICSKFTGEHPCRSVISIKLLLLHIFGTPFTKNTSEWLLMKLRKPEALNFRTLAGGGLRM